MILQWDFKERRKKKCLINKSVKYKYFDSIFKFEKEFSRIFFNFWSEVSFYAFCWWFVKWVSSFLQTIRCYFICRFKPWIKLFDCIGFLFVPFFCLIGAAFLFRRAKIEELFLWHACNKFLFLLKIQWKFCSL